jgi:hypothetical protein
MSHPTSAMIDAAEAQWVADVAAKIEASPREHVTRLLTAALSASHGDVQAKVFYMPGNGWWCDVQVGGRRVHNTPCLTHIGAKWCARRWIRKVRAGWVPALTDHAEIYT